MLVLLRPERIDRVPQKRDSFLVLFDSCWLEAVFHNRHFLFLVIFGVGLGAQRRKHIKHALLLACVAQSKIGNLLLLGLENFHGI